MLTLAEELYFWTGILRDHSEFIITALSSRETEFSKTAQAFKNQFINFNHEAQMILNNQASPEAEELAHKITPVLVNFINFKRLALRRLLKCNIELNMSPNLINHMISEAMKFYEILCKAGNIAPVNPVAINIGFHKLWLPDAAGHAAAIISGLDPTETKLIKEAEKFKKIFDNLYIKSDELGKMLERACLQDGTLDRLNREAEEDINEFICFLDNIRKLREQCKVLGTIKPLMPDHMIREEKYYLTKLKSMEKDLCR